MDRFRARSAIVVVIAGLLGAAELPAQPRQVVKPPQAHAWIDVATFGGIGLPAGGGMMSASLGSLFGGGGENAFGRTGTGQTGRWVDVTVSSRSQPHLAEARQQVPAAFLAPPLVLKSPAAGRDRPVDPDRDEVTEPEFERPRGRLLMYWGCGDTVRSGQPKVLDMASANVADLGRFFVSRRATQRGTHAAPGRPVWPNPDDRRLVPAGASLVGEHRIEGAGLPEGWRFALGAAQDLMPTLELKQAVRGGATELQWNAAPQARAHFVAAMGAGAQEEMILWTSSELPDTGMGLIDYQPNAAIDRWLKERVLLPAEQTRCTIPAGVFPGGESAGAMLRLIAYGSELNLAHPPRPADPKVAWEPQWAVKLRLKSVTTAMLGEAGEAGAEPGKAAAEPADGAGVPKVKDLIKGIFGR